MHVLRLYIHVDAFGLAHGGAWEWRRSDGSTIVTRVLAMEELLNWTVEQAAVHLARLAMDRAETQLRLF